MTLVGLASIILGMITVGATIIGTRAAIANYAGLGAATDFATTLSRRNTFHVWNTIAKPTQRKIGDRHPLGRCMCNESYSDSMWLAHIQPRRHHL